MAAVIPDHIDISKANSKKLPWYYDEIGNKLRPEGRRILEDCGVAASEVEDHIRKVRDQAWEIFPFPCIGNFWFIEFGLSRHPHYSDVLRLLKQDDDDDDSTSTKHEPTSETHDSATDAILNSPESLPKLIDIGTCVGQDLRMLHSHGVPVSSLYGSDYFPGFEAVGHELFLDAETFKHHFLAADIFDDSPSSLLNLTAGRWDVVTSTLFFHQFDLAQQKAAAGRMVRLLKKDRKGAMVLGTSAGQLVAEEVAVPPPFGDKEGKQRVFRQNEGSMREMWEEAVERFGGGKGLWRVETGYGGRRGDGRKDSHYFKGDEQRSVYFWVERL